MDVLAVTPCRHAPEEELRTREFGFCVLAGGILRGPVPSRQLLQLCILRFGLL
jgi:hypothetical protein